MSVFTGQKVTDILMWGTN